MRKIIIITDSDDKLTVAVQKATSIIDDEPAGLETLRYEEIDVPSDVTVKSISESIDTDGVDTVLDNLMSR